MVADKSAGCDATESFGLQCQALLEVAESIAFHRDLAGLFHDLAERLHRLVSFQFLNLILHDPARKIMRLHILESSSPTPIQAGSEFPVDQSPGGWVWETQQPLVVNDIEQETRFPQITAILRQHGVNSFCVVPLTTAQRRLGAMGFGSVQCCVYDEDHLQFLLQVARQVAVAVDNALNYQDAQVYQQQLARERDRLRLVLDVNNTVVANLEPRQLFEAIAGCLRRVLNNEYTGLALHDPETQELRLWAIDFPGGKGLVQEEMVLPIEGTPAGRAFSTRQPVLLDGAALRQFSSPAAKLLAEEGFESGCCLPLINRDRVFGTVNVASRRPNAFSPEDVDLLSQVANQLAIAVENALAYREIAQLKEKLAEEKLYLEDEIRTEHNFEEIIGESPALLRVLKQVETVAPTNSSVLLQGETGTGKEVIARAIHNLSSRRGRTFVKVNCAAIPSGLLESELFGHEKGAFTGAIAQRIGRFELAHQGTLFLDEVADIPLELQPKLLRVLQEHEFERLGGTRTQRVDVRVVAATNRDLAQMVAEKQFRDDLYYRLNVFPVVVPPLRERREDIPALVRYFANKYARRMNKQIETISSDIMDTLVQWHWPGNVRELENIIERAVILTQGPVLRVPVAQFKATPEGIPASFVTMQEAERQHILRALDETHWTIGGPRGAATRLGMKRTTLQSRMQKLGINRQTARPSA
jgi:formate hydrogenlyase transcriptional activator